MRFIKGFAKIMVIIFMIGFVFLGYLKVFRYDGNCNDKNEYRKITVVAGVRG